MRCRQYAWPREREASDREATLLLVFGPHAVMVSPDLFADLRAAHPNALIVGCSTAGEIRDTRVRSDTAIVTAIGLASTRVALESAEVQRSDGSFATGALLAQRLSRPDLRHVLVISDGLRVNGSGLARGFESALAKGVSLSGGLSGD